MREPKPPPACKQGMAKRYDLFTDQDLQAFADDEIDGERLRALLKKFDADPARLSRARRITEMNELLQVMGGELYRADAELARTVEGLMSRQASDTQPAGTDARRKKRADM